MKIVVAPPRRFHALSRKQVEAIFAILPKEFSVPIREFIIQEGYRCHEPLEYYRPAKRVTFAMPVDEKTDLTTREAVIALLIGIARIRAKSKFAQPLSRLERESYSEFVKEWAERALKAALT